MGGAVDIVTSALGMITDLQKAEGRTEVSGQYQALKEEREAQEQAQLEREADERRRNRDKVMEARELDRKRLAAGKKRKTTLGNGGAGLLKDPELDVPVLKEKFGE